MTVHAQVDGIGTLEFPDGTDPAVIQGAVKKMVESKGQAHPGFLKGVGQGGVVTPDKPPAKPQERTWRDTAKDVATGYGRAVAGPVEGAMALASGSIAAPVAGLAGMAQGAKNFVTGEGTPAADRVSSVQDALTYQPRTELGQATAGAAAKPFELLAAGADKAGAWTADKTGSPALGATVNTVLQAAPSAILPELAGKGPLGARIAARRAAAAPPARIEPSVGQTPGQTPGAPGPAPVSGTPPPRPVGAPSEPVPFQADPNAPAAPKAPLNTPARQSAEQRAQDYVRNRVGVAWDSLSTGLKDTITSIAKDAGSLEKLNPDDVARKARLDAGGIKATRGQVTRDLGQLTKEENLVKSEAGRDIRNIKADQDTRLHELVDAVRKDTGATAETRSQAGDSVQNKGLRAKLRASKANYDKLYKSARETEPEATVSTDPMYDFVRGNPEVLNPSIQHLNWLQSWLKKAGIESEGEVATPAAASTRRGSMGEPIEETTAAGTKTEVQRRGVKLAELDDLRKKALSIAKGGGDNAHYAGEVIKAIDKSFEEIPSAAKAWKEARDAFKAHKTEYDEQGIIKKLATDKTRTDRRVAVEKTVDTVMRGSVEDITALKTSLTEGHLSPENEAAGVQAWKDVQGSVVDKLKEAATGKREIGNEQGVTQFNSSFRNVFNELDKDGKIDAIFSPEQAKRLRDINQLVEDVRTTPSGRVAGSDTVPRIISMLDGVGKLPLGIGKLAGPVADIAAGVATKAWKAGKEGREVRRAQADPLEDAVKGAKKNIRGRRNKAAAGAAAPAFTIGEQLQRDQQ